MKEIWVVAENFQNKIDSGSLQLLTKLREIKPKEQILSLVIPVEQGKNYQEVITSANHYGADQIRLLEVAVDCLTDENLLGDILVQAYEEVKPDSILFSATVFGRSVAPRIQAKLQTALTADVVDLYFEDESLVQVKPSFGDNLLVEIISPEARPQMATIRPNTFKEKAISEETKKIIVNDYQTASTIAALQHNELADNPSKAGKIAGADYIISVGRGVENEESIQKLRIIAEKLGVTLGATRPVANGEFFEHKDQIGQSGETVSPSVLVNIGISGSTQYVAGIKNAKKIISVNKDFKAPILAESDYIYVGDGNRIIDKLLAKLN